MHKNELVNILLAARTDMLRHQERLARYLSVSARDRGDVDRQDAAEVERLITNVLRELDEAITQRSLKR